MNEFRVGQKVVFFGNVPVIGTITKVMRSSAGAISYEIENESGLEYEAIGSELIDYNEKERIAIRCQSNRDMWDLEMREYLKQVNNK